MIQEPRRRCTAPGPLRMSFRYAAASLRARMQYRSSFLMESLGHIMAAVTELLGIVVLFGRFGSIRGWTVSEVALFYGVVHVVFAVAEGVGGGFESLESHVKNGTFDRVLLRPRSTLLQVLGAALAPETIGRLVLAALVLGWALAALDGDPWQGTSRSCCGLSPAASRPSSRCSCFRPPSRSGRRRHC